MLDRRGEKRPIVIVGDIHGSFYTLTETLLPKLGFASDGSHPDNLLLVSVGDLHDRAGVHGVAVGDPSLSGAVSTLRWAMEWSAKGALDVVDSNHGKKLARKLTTGETKGPDGSPFGHGLDDTLEDLYAQEDSDILIPLVTEFLGSRPSFALYSGGPTGEIAVAHAALKNRFIGAESMTRKEKDFCIFPRAFDWYGTATVVVGHVVTPGVIRESNTRNDGSPAGDVIRIDTGAFDGGGLSVYLPDSDTTVTVPTDSRDLPDEDRRYRNRFEETS